MSGVLVAAGVGLGLGRPLPVAAQAVTADGGDGTDPAFVSGRRRLHVHPEGGAPLDGTVPDDTFATIQSAINASMPGDVVTIASGTYREVLSLAGKRGNASVPIWIVAEIRGGVRVADTFQAGDDATATWRAEGGGVYSTPCSSRPYAAYHADNDDWLFPYLTVDDLRAKTITARSAMAGGALRTIAKPPYGMAYSGNRLYVRLRDDQAPGGQRIVASGSFARAQLRATDCHHLILDGLVFEGAGNTGALSVADSCTAITVRNCEFSLCRFGVRNPTGTRIETCTYHYVGFGQWARDVLATDGSADNGVFVLCKGYYNAAAVSDVGTPVGGGSGNALLEGSLDIAVSANPPPTDVIIDGCLIGPCFDGSRLGTNNHSVIRNSVFLECRDDGVQNEGGWQRQPATGNRIHDCRFINCFHDISVQGADNVGDFHVYRCVIEWNDATLAIPNNYSLKMNRTSERSNNFFYHCTWIVDYGRAVGGPQRLWTGFGGPVSDADKIRGFVNNVVVVPRELSQGSGGQPNPADVGPNAVVGPSEEVSDFLIGNGGVFAGSSPVDMALATDYSLLENSPARDIGTALPADFPDSRTGSGTNRDAGAFPYGEVPGPAWPRPSTITYDIDPPSSWPFS